MLTSVAWINDHLDRPADADEQAEVLTAAGFPLEGRCDVAGDVQQDFEMTSNRGDCTCHTGLAREIAAATGRGLVMPDCDVEATGDPIQVQVDNHAPDVCPRYTARVIRGVTIAPGSDHVRARLEARGDIPRNNVVDATNFVLFELGHPTHAFDLDSLEGGRIEIRMARPGERFLPLGEDGTEIELDGSELVIADAVKPVALAGVKGGAACAVTESTTNLLIEAATFDPVLVRHASRLHNITSDSSFRFERGVSPLNVDEASKRLCRLIMETAGGTLDSGLVDAGAALPDRIQVSMRLARCRSLLGLDLDDTVITDALDRLGFDPVSSDGVVACTVPPHRGDISREVDLIEEVMRMHGFDDVPVRDRIEVKPVTEPLDEVRRQAMSEALVAEGFLEIVTHTLTTLEAASALIDGTPLQLDDARAMADDTLRPTVLTGLLKVRRHNADRGSAPGMRLFELGSAFDPDEVFEVCLLMDEGDEGIRPLRAAVDQVARVLAGADAAVRVDEGGCPAWLSPGGTITLDGSPLGWIGRVDASVWNDQDVPLCAAVLRPAPWMDREPEATAIEAPPPFPAIERDVSAIVAEPVAWTALADTVAGLDLPLHEHTGFVTVYRGKGIEPEHKSVTLRLRFRSPDRTLTHEEVDAPMERVIDALQSTLDAEVRS